MSFRSKKVRMETLQQNTTEAISTSSGLQKQHISSAAQVQSVSAQVQPQKVPPKSTPSVTSSRPFATPESISKSRPSVNSMPRQVSTLFGESRMQSQRANLSSAASPMAEASHPTFTSSTCNRVLPQNLSKLSRPIFSEKSNAPLEKRHQGDQVTFGPFAPHSISSQASAKSSLPSSSVLQSEKPRGSSLCNSSRVPSVSIHTSNASERQPANTHIDATPTVDVNAQAGNSRNSDPPLQSPNLQSPACVPIVSNPQLHQNIEPGFSTNSLHVDEHENNVVSEHNHLENSAAPAPKKAPRIRAWPHDIVVGKDEKVLTIAVDGTEKWVGGSIQPRDVSTQNEVRYFVKFNEFKQPIYKGGAILVKFLSYLAKMERFCPIGETDWRYVSKKLKADLIELMRAKFVIPQGEVYDKQALQRVDKFWRNHKCSLKKEKFNPQVRSIQEIYDDKPDGHPRNSWIKLVDYWLSPKGQEKSRIAKEARASQDLLHTTGSISHANMREHFKRKFKRAPSNLEMFEVTRKPKEGEFPDDSMSKEFLEQAKSKVQTSLASSSSSKSRVDVENDVFDELMYDEDNLKRPIGYGFGVSKTTVFGVEGELRKRGHFYDDNSMTARLLTKQNQLLLKRNKIYEAKLDESNQKMNQSNQLFLQVLDVMSTGQVTTQFLNATRQTVLQMTNTQVPMGSKGRCDTNSRSMHGDDLSETESGDHCEHDGDVNTQSDEDTPSSNYSPSPSTFSP